jgi:hypothetical protein
MEAQPALAARATALSGGRSELFKSSGSVWDISQFWQNRQWRLHPAVATEKAREPGRKWYIGFFSTGST